MYFIRATTKCNYSVWAGRPLDGSIKVQTGCAEQGWGKALCLPSLWHGCSLPLCVVADTGLVQGGGKKMERPGGYGERVTQFLLSHLTPSPAHRWRSAEAWQRVKSIWVLGVRCEGSTAFLGQPSEQSLLSLSYVREWPFTAGTKTALKSLGHQAIVLTVSPSFSSKLSLWA